MVYNMHTGSLSFLVKYRGWMWYVNEIKTVELCLRFWSIGNQWDKCISVGLDYVQKQVVNVSMLINGAEVCISLFFFFSLSNEKRLIEEQCDDWKHQGEPEGNLLKHNCIYR